MEKMDGIAGAFVNNGITLLMSEDKPLNEGKVKDLLKGYKITVKAVQRADKLPF